MAARLRRERNRSVSRWLAEMIEGMMRDEDDYSEPDNRQRADDWIEFLVRRRAGGSLHERSCDIHISP